MRFSIGYYPADEHGEPFEAMLEEFSTQVAEVYFPWKNIRTCRNHPEGLSQQALLRGLSTAKAMGIRRNLLVNANCYGGQAISTALFSGIARALDALGGVEAVTTTSIAVADMVRWLDPDIEIRASVNMQLGERCQFEALEDLFDSFYLMREYNYDLTHIARTKAFLNERGKALHLLANSGCMAYCPGQVFHDNLVAHEAEISQSDNLEAFNPYVCWRAYGRQQAPYHILQNCWIRPEDLHHYEGLFDTAKLATRIHQTPRRVIRAYVRGSYHGNVLDLTEPSYSSLIAPDSLENKAFPADWYETRSRCGRRCEGCGYCEKVWAGARVDAQKLEKEVAYR